MPWQAWRLEAARRMRRSRAAPASPAHLAQALAPAQLAAHLAWSPALDPGRAKTPTRNPTHSPIKARLGISLDGGLVGATADLGALQRALGYLLTLQHALRLGPDTGPSNEAGSVGLHAPVAPHAHAAAGPALGAPLEVHVALQCVRMDVRPRCSVPGRASFSDLMCLRLCKGFFWSEHASSLPEAHVMVSVFSIHGPVLRYVIVLCQHSI